MLEVIKRLEAIDKKLDLMEQCRLAAKDKKNYKARLKRAAASAGADGHV